MPKIIPISDLRNTNELSEMVCESSEPVYITKNGYGSMVIMSMEADEERMSLLDLYSKIAVAEDQYKNGEYKDAKEVLERLRKKYVRENI